MDAVMALYALVAPLAAEAQIPPELVLGIIEVESGGAPACARLNPTYPYTMPQARRPALCTQDTELLFQRTAWGLMQVMGATARETGFDGWLPELAVPETNLRVGVAHLARLWARFGARHGVDGVIAAWNAGAPRKGPDGRFVNQGYVNRVAAAMKRYEPLCGEKGKDRESPDVPDAPKAPEFPKTPLSKMRRDELLALCASRGIEAQESATVAELRALLEGAPAE